MKYLWILIVLVIIVGGIFMWSKPSDAPSDTTTPSEGVAVDEQNPDTPATPGVKEFAVTGANFSFSPAEMRAKLGDTVRIKFTAAEGFHDLKISEFEAATKQLKAGESETIEFVVNQTGTFEYYCSVGTHRASGMVGKLIVE